MEIIRFVLQEDYTWDTEEDESGREWGSQEQETILETQPMADCALGQCQGKREGRN